MVSFHSQYTEQPAYRRMLIDEQMFCSSNYYFAMTVNSTLSKSTYNREIGMSQIKHVLFFTSIIVDHIIAFFRCNFFHKSVFPETKENDDETNMKNKRILYV